jgi:hypothetical protein
MLRYSSRMPCDHVGPAELIEMAESHLSERRIQATPGMRFAFGENLTDGMWASVLTEIERRGEQWVVVRLDRNREPLPDEQVGLRVPV